MIYNQMVLWGMTARELLHGCLLLDHENLTIFAMNTTMFFLS